MAPRAQRKSPGLLSHNLRHLVDRESVRRQPLTEVLQPPQLCVSEAPAQGRATGAARARVCLRGTRSWRPNLRSRAHTEARRVCGKPTASARGRSFAAAQHVRHEKRTWGAYALRYTPSTRAATSKTLCMRPWSVLACAYTTLSPSLALSITFSQVAAPHCAAVDSASTRRTVPRHRGHTARSATHV